MAEEYSNRSHAGANYCDQFDAKRYLTQYYSRADLSADDRDLFLTFGKWLKQLNKRFPRALDLGCGPTIHNTFAIAPFVDSIELADYLPANLAEVQRWLDASPTAHNWDALFTGVLRCQGEDVATLERRKREYRDKVCRLRLCDLRQPYPLGEAVTFDLVTSFFCAECISESFDDWRGVMRRLLAHVGRGGAVFLATLRKAKEYSVLGTWFDTVSIDEKDLIKVLRENGFTRESIRAIAVPAPDWAEDGFDHICLASGLKP